MTATTDKPARQPLTGWQDSLQAWLHILQAPQQQFVCYSPIVDARLFAHPELVEQLRQRIIQRPKTHISLLLPSARTWRTQCPNLVALLGKLSTALELRYLPAQISRERAEYGTGFVIAGRGEQLLYWSDPQRLQGHYYPYGTPEGRNLLDFFQAIWTQALPDPELRPLGI